MNTMPAGRDSATIIRDFLRDWGTEGWTKSFDAYIHPDCVWKNTGFPDAVGKADVMALLRTMVNYYNIDICHVELLNVAHRGTLVLTERRDTMELNDGSTHLTLTMGAFEVKDGLIHYYADYFDPTPFTDQLPAFLAAYEKERTKPRAVIERMFDDFRTDGFEAAMERHLHPDAIWQNTGFPDAVGKPAIMALARRFLEAVPAPIGRIDILRCAENGNVVLMERVDHVLNADGTPSHSSHLMGLFEVEDGQIKRWSDYLNPADFPIS